MGKLKIKKRQSIAIEGFIELTIVNKKDNFSRTFKNTITNGGKQFLLDKCAGRMLSMAGDTFGMVTTSGLLNKVGTTGSNPFGGRTGYMDRDITNVLLNLGDEANSLTGSSTYINIWDNALSDRTKLVGYANSNVSPTANGLEGAIDYCRGQYVIDPYTCCERWKYGEGIASGTIDTIAMMPASCVKTNRGDGIAFSKCIDRINQQYVNYVNMSTGFLIPGIMGYTANDEILLNFNQDSNSRWKFSLTTGEISAVSPSDPFFIVENVESGRLLLDIVRDGSYMYVLRSTGTDIPTTSGRYMIAYVYDITAGMNLVTSFILDYGLSSEYRVGGKFLKIGSSMYVTTWCDYFRIGNIGAGYNKMFTLSKGSNAYYSSAIGVGDYSSIGFSVPSGLDIKQIGLGNYNDQYVMFVNTPVDGTLSQTETGCLSYGITFTSLTDPIGTMTGKISGITPNSVLFTAGSNKGYLRIGFNFISEIVNTFGGTLDFTDSLKRIWNNTNNTSGTTVSTMKTGVFMCLDGWYTDVISFVKLNTPIVVGDMDTLYVSYGYKVV